MSKRLFRITFPPIAGILVEISDHGLRRLSLISDKSVKHYVDSSLEAKDILQSDVDSSMRLFEALGKQLSEYFDGKREQFRVPLDLSQGTEFQIKIWEILRDIPYGKVMTYGQVALEAGIPGGARAVGNACARNPIPIIVPCHRVIRSDRSLGGYTAGADAKASLLRLEKVL